MNVVKLDLGVEEMQTLGQVLCQGNMSILPFPKPVKIALTRLQIHRGPSEGLTFYIKILESGVMSDFLRGRAKQGDLLNIEGPFGHFYLRGQNGLS